MADRTNPIRETDADAIATARYLLQSAKTCALAVLDPTTGAPMVTRAAFAQTDEGQPMTLISDLSAHTKALRADPRASLLVGEPVEKGDHLNQPRITLQTSARFISRDDPAHPDLRATYLRHLPKSKLYIDFADFNLVVFDIEVAHLNGGFGKAYRLDTSDLLCSKNTPG